MGARGCDRCADGSTWVIHPAAESPQPTHALQGLLGMLQRGAGGNKLRSAKCTSPQAHDAGRTHRSHLPKPQHMQSRTETLQNRPTANAREQRAPPHQCQSSLLCRCFPLCLFGTNALGRIVITTHNNGSTLLLKQQNGGSGDGGCGGAQLRRGSYRHGKRAGQPTNKRFLRMQFSLFNYQQFWKKKCSLVWISKPRSWTVPSAGR